MKTNQWLVTVGIAAGMCLSASNVLAQNNNSNGNNNGRQSRRGGGGPPTAEQMAQYQQQRMDRYKQELEITDDAEWKAIQPLVEKVSQARRGMMAYAGFGRGGFSGRGGPGGGPGGGGGFGGTPDPNVEALQKAIEGKASNTEMKAAIAKFQESRKAKMADLEKAQADLRKVLSVRQEAIATASGLL
jgi:hypothetical protein